MSDHVETYYHIFESSNIHEQSATVIGIELRVSTVSIRCARIGIKLRDQPANPKGLSVGLGRAGGDLANA